MKLTYWVAECLTDSKRYNLRASTRKAVVAMLAQGEYGEGQYGRPRKVSIGYSSALDLVSECLTEGGGYWENAD